MPWAHPSLFSVRNLKNSSAARYLTGSSSLLREIVHTSESASTTDSPQRLGKSVA